jgi:2-methylcitrate dehydratase PrpD
MAERQSASGTVLLRAIALGYDISSRVSPALGGYALSASGRDTHSHGTMFGAAAACGSLARLDERQVRHMLSWTSQQASGLSNYARDTEHIEKAFIFGGMPARNGATAATMVASGMSGIEDVFSGDRSLFHAYSSTNANPELLVRALGETYEILNTNIKRWTVGSPIQAPLDSLSTLIKEHQLKAKDVEKVVVRVSQQGARTTNNRHMPDINMQYMVSVMLLDGTASLEAAHDIARMNAPEVLEMRNRVELLGDDALQAALPIRQGIVDVTLRDGRVLHHHTQNVRGTPANPMPREEVEEKAFNLLRPIIKRKRAKELIETIWKLEEVEDVKALRKLTRA